MVVVDMHRDGQGGLLGTVANILEQRLRGEKDVYVF